ncbi:MAG: FtsX-like permease family protein [Acidimicrobiales bacterium]|nr:FtsX-like permease family protein [Acidimicrobiales bacterium]
MAGARARRVRLWVRWSLRDLRRRWVLVAAIALIIAIGTGAYAGLGSTAEWRYRSNDASYAALDAHELKVSLAEGSVVPAGDLLGVVGSIADPDRVAVAEERLVLPTQLDASTGDEAILVPGRLVGVDVVDGGPHVDLIEVEGGRGLDQADDGRPVALVEAKFADTHDLPLPLSIELTGGSAGASALEAVGWAITPEYFLVLGSSRELLSAGNYAIVFVPLATAQEITGNPDGVNDLVLRATPGTDVDALAADVERAFASRLPDAGATVLTIADDEGRRILYDDIANDQRFWNVFAFLILAGAAVAAFNLISRIVESQRREIGVGMALGARRASLAIRPMLVGVEVALLGVVLGVVVGYLLTQAMKQLFVSLLPMPVWITTFQPDVFLQAALIGLLLPVLATVYPVWRAVRVPPVAAIRTGHLATRGPSRLLRRIRVPGGSLAQMPVRNVLRSPRRTLLTALGIGAAITVMVATFGTIDSFVFTLDTAETELLGGRPDRLIVVLDSYQPVDSPTVRAVTGSPAAADAQTILDVGALLTNDRGDELEALVEVLPLSGDGWQPRIVDAVDPADLGGRAGIILAEKAARDLGVEPGDVVTLRHPRREGLGIRVVDDPVVVAGLHPLPLRPYAFMDTAAASLFGAEGVANAVQLEPAPGSTPDDTLRALFGLPGVSSVRSVASTADYLQDSMDQIIAVMQLAAALVLLLALLIAFNATSISVDERVREHATMFAFGVRVRTVVGMSMTEGLATGLLGTAFGLLLGTLVMRWVVYGLTGDTMPDLGVIAHLTPVTIATAVVLGVLAVAVAPLLTIRKLRRTDLPSALRVVE